MQILRLRFFLGNGFKQLCIRMMFLLVLLPSFADAGEVFYYSIHLASFKNLINANRQVNQLKVKGKIVFWKEADIPGKGIFYRVYIGKYNEYEQALNAWKMLDEEGKVNYLGVHKFSERNSPTNKKLFGSKAEPLHSEPIIPRRDTGETGRFVDNGDGTVTDILTKLMWVQNGWRLDLVSAETWWEAQKICSEFNACGYDDWRVPSIAEWKSLIDKKMQWPAMVEPNPFINMIVQMPYWTNNSWSPKKSGDYSSRAYIIMLHSGDFYHQNKKERAFILPVRSIK